MEAVNLLSSNRYTEKQIVSMVEVQGPVPYVQFADSSFLSVAYWVPTTCASGLSYCLVLIPCSHAYPNLVLCF